MTRDQIDKWAEECVITTGPRAPYFDIDAFAQRVATAEREACAKLCEEQGSGRRALEHYAALTYSGAAFECAVAIRARNDT